MTDKDIVKKITMDSKGYRLEVAYLVYRYLLVRCSVLVQVIC